MAPAAALSEGAASGAARPPRPLPARAGPGRPEPDSGRPRGLGPSFGEDEGTPSDWDPRNACMTEEEEAIARRQTTELRAAGQPPPPPCSADAAADPPPAGRRAEACRRAAAADDAAGPGGDAGAGAREGWRGRWRAAAARARSPGAHAGDPAEPAEGRIKSGLAISLRTQPTMAHGTRSHGPMAPCAVGTRSQWPPCDEMLCGR